MRLQHPCKYCGKAAELLSEIPMGTRSLYAFKCGHSEIRETVRTAPTETRINISTVGGVERETSVAVLDEEEKETPETLENFFSVDRSKEVYPFQQEGVHFTEAADFKVLIADAMGLGKTVQALSTLTRNRERTLPALVIVKSSTIFQWIGESKTWLDARPFFALPILDRACMIPGYQVYVISMDLLSRKGIVDKLLTFGIKTVVVDECQSFKDSSSKRTVALIDFIQRGKIENRIFLSGTPIKNRASEYFVILNLLAPEHFPSFAQFKHRWLVPNEKGQYTRLNPYCIEEFRALTSRWIIRREKTEVLKNLPPMARNTEMVYIEDPRVRQSYNQQLDLFNNFLNTAERITATDILGWLAKMRHITGLAKVQNALEFIEEHLESSEEPISVGIHHTSVRDLLHTTLTAKGFKPLKLSGEDSPWMKNRIIERFTEGDSRILIINMLAGGVGLNIQSCPNALVLERQWSSADEEQFEARFHRNGQKNAVTITYMIAKGTIDEWFHELVETKRKILGETLDGWDLSSDDDAIKGLVEKTLAGRI